MSKDIAAILAGAKLPEDTVDLCLRADLVAEHERLDSELEALLDQPAKKLGGDPRRAELAVQIVALEEQMRESTITVRLRAMPKRRWRQMVMEHPPRLDEDGNRIPVDFRGVNSDTFYDPLIRASVIEPKLTDEQWTNLLGHTAAEAEALEAVGKGDEVEDGLLTSRQHELLVAAAWDLNRDEVSVPFSSAASRLTPSSSPA
jgi:hypothetical protein